MQNKFFKISTDYNSPSEAEPSCAFSSKSVKKDEVRCILVLNWFFEYFKTKMPLTLFFFTDLDEYAHEGSALNGESESVLI